MSECSVCLDDAPTGADLCASCAAWKARWSSLTPEQRRAEIKAMDDYASSYEDGERL